MAEQEVTMEGLVISDLSQQIAQTSVDRSAWAARAKIAEELLAQAQAKIAELEVDETEEEEGE